MRGSNVLGIGFYYQLKLVYKSICINKNQFLNRYVVLALNSKMTRPSLTMFRVFLMLFLQNKNLRKFSNTLKNFRKLWKSIEKSFNQSTAYNGQFVRLHMFGQLVNKSKKNTAQR